MEPLIRGAQGLAKVLGCSRAHAERLIRAKEVDVLRSGRALMIEPAAVRKYIEKLKSAQHAAEVTR